MDWKGRVRKKMAEQRINELDLAEKAGFSQASINRWLHGARSCRLESRIAIAHALGVSIEWLDTGQELAGKNELPVLESINSEVMALLSADRITESLPAEWTTKRTLRAFPDASTSSFVIPMNDDTMINPDNLTSMFFPKGCHVTIDPKAAPISGDVIFVKLDDEYLLRQWTAISQKKHVLSIINPKYHQISSVVYDGDIENILLGTAIGFTYSVSR